MFVTGRFGLKSYDVSNPEKPVALDSIDMPGFWQNEDMDVDPEPQARVHGTRPAGLRPEPGDR